MTLDPRTPVVVGIAAVGQREEDPSQAAEVLELMARALEAAADDAGSRDWLARAELVMAPRGFWTYPDPCRALADRFGAEKAKTMVAEIGVLQTTLFSQAIEAVRGGADCVLVTGAEAKFRQLRATITGGEAPETQQPEGLEPDAVLRPKGEIMHPMEVQLGLGAPVAQYAMLENALRFKEGQSVDAHRREVGELWAGMSAVAAEYPHAWRRERLTTEQVAFEAPKNPMLSFPYTKLENSQWNVDQASGFIVTSVEAARAAGVPEDRWIFPRAVSESNHMVSVLERAEPARCPGFQIAGKRALERAGVSADGLGPSELYSCFPVAVRVQQREMGVPLDRPVSVTGGMAFGGGPLNNFVLQAGVGVMEALRREPGEVGMLTAVSGILTKQGVSLWSTAPPEGEAPLCSDVSREVEAATATVEVDPEYRGAASISAYTVQYMNGEPVQASALCDVGDGRRTLGVSNDPDLMASMQQEEFVGRTATVGEERALHVDG